MIVQTLEPEAQCLRHAAAHDADGFLGEELARRRLLSYPPFATLIRVVCSSERAGRRSSPPPRRSASGSTGPPVLGPAPLFRLKGRERAQLVVKAAERAPARARGAPGRRGGRRRARARGGVNFAVDVDPQ